MLLNKQSANSVRVKLARYTIANTILLQDAPFWDEAQQHFIAESLAVDGDWSEVIDELDVRLRQKK